MTNDVPVRVPRLAEALLQSLGADGDFVDDVLGDLAEEYAVRIRWDGVFAARRWYYSQAIRTGPYLLRDWCRRLGLSDASSVAGTVVLAFLAALPVDAAIVVVVSRLTFALTGIPLATQDHHWVLTGDMMPAVMIALAARRTIPAAVAGYVAGVVGKRAPLVHSLILASGLFAWGAGIVATRSATISSFVSQVFSFAAPYAVSCLAGGILAALWVQRRASHGSDPEPPRTIT